MFRDARAARDFGAWVDARFDAIKAKAEETTRYGRLRNIEQYGVGKMRFLRFDFTTGDAAGQNMVTKATRHACLWMLEQARGAGALRAGGQRRHRQEALGAEQPAHARQARRRRGDAAGGAGSRPSCTPSGKALYRMRQLSNMGSLLSGSTSNGAHYANAIAAMFIACGQDVGNVAESSAGLSYSELKDNGDYYFSVTIPSLIVASCGGGTSLPTQRECLEVLGCYGEGRAYKLAEIVAATVLCGELSLGSAIVADQWVSSHEAFGRNRP